MSDSYIQSGKNAPLKRFDGNGGKEEWSGSVWQQTSTGGSRHSYASAKEFQPVTGATAVTINNGLAMGVKDDNGGAVLVFDTTKQTGVSLTLEKGFNPIEVINVVSTSAPVTLLAW